MTVSAVCQTVEATIRDGQSKINRMVNKPAGSPSDPLCSYDPRPGEGRRSVSFDYLRPNHIAEKSMTIRTTLQTAAAVAAGIIAAAATASVDNLRKPGGVYLLKPGISVAEGSVLSGACQRRDPAV
jgi:hypothetical protein